MHSCSAIRRWRIRALLSFCLILSSKLGAQTQQRPHLGFRDQVVTAVLVSPISTKTAKQKDRIVARVSAPPTLDGAVIEGEIQKVSKAKNNEQSDILFSFQTLTWKGVTYPIRADLKDVANSKGIQSVDEEGRAIGKSSSKKRILATLLASAAGAAIGAAAAGGKGAAIGAGAGAAAGLLIAVKFTAKGPDIEFAPGSQFVLLVSDRDVQ